MNPFLIMEQHKDQFTQNDMRIYKAILGNPGQVTYQSTNKLAENLGVSQPALSRFIKMLGYAKYQDFRNDITTWIAKESYTADSSRLGYFDRLNRLLQEAEQVLTKEYMKEIASYVLEHNRIFAGGIGKSMNSAYLLGHLFRKHDLFVLPTPLDSLNNVTDHMASDDLLILFSVSAQAEIMHHIEGAGGDILLVTTNAAHKYKDSVDKTVILPYLPPDPELCSVSPILFDVFVELLDEMVTDILSEKES